MIKKSTARIKKYIDYITSIDRIWLYTWGIIFVGFIILDSYFQARFHGHNVFWDFDLFGKISHIKVISNGTFIGVTFLKYAGIILNVIYAHKKFPNDYLLQIALFLTLLADTILMINSTSEVGVLAFCFAQYFHLSRFSGANPTFIFAWTFFMAIVLFFGQIHGVQDMYVLAAIYGATLLGNILLTLRWWKRTKQGIVAAPVNKNSQISTTKKSSNKNEPEIIKRFKKRYINLPKEAREREIIASTCAALGFILFMCCDINVALSYLAVTGTLPIRIAVFANFFAWFFYYPSQVLISNSSVILEKTSKKE